MDYQKVIDMVRQKHAERKKAEEDRLKRLIAEMMENEFTESQFLMATRPAAMNEYHEWLRGYIENGGIPNVIDDNSFKDMRWRTAMRDLKPISLFSAHAYNIIIPEGIKAPLGQWGHCNLFYVDGFRPVGGIVPIYKDTDLSIDNRAVDTAANIDTKIKMRRI